MYRVDLIPREIRREGKIWPVARWAAVLLTVCHLMAMGWAWLFAWNRSAAVAGLAEEERRLKAELAALDDPADMDVLAGAVIARAAWFVGRERSPIRFLRMLEAGQPTAGLLREADMTAGGGRAVVSVPDQDAAVTWFQSLPASGTRHAETDPTPAPDGGVTVRWTWTAGNS